MSTGSLFDSLSDTIIFAPAVAHDLGIRLTLFL